jgi:hypothetical protein
LFLKKTIRNKGEAGVRRQGSGGGDSFQQKRRGTNMGEGSRIEGELFLKKTIRNNYCASLAARGQVVKEHGHGVTSDSAVPGEDIIAHMF